MKRGCILLLFILLSVYSQDAFSQRTILSKITNEKIGIGPRIEVHPFNLKQNFLRDDEVSSIVSKSTFLELDKSTISKHLSKQPDLVTMNIPVTQNRNFTMDLVENKIFTTDVVFTTSSGETISPSTNRHYHGVVRGYESSIASISLVDGEMIGIISIPNEGNYVLGQYGSEENSYIIYNDHDILEDPDISCHSEFPALNQQQLDELNHAANSGLQIREDKCVRVYFELDYDLVQEKGGVSNAVNFMSGLFNVVSTLYANDGITMKISEIFSWDTPDSYPTGSISNTLVNFRNTRQNYNGDLAHLVSRGAPKSGGIAWVDAVCSTFGYAYSYINSGYNQFPKYSWTINVITHEMGHNLGSPHTQSCSWSGGPLDNCYSPEGSCAAGPTPTNGGTIMSYCHLTSHGINFSNGFGDKPSALIRSKIAGASCLTTCGSSAEPTCSDGIKNGSETGIDCGGNCTPCVTCNDGIKNGNETGVDCGGSCDPCTTCNDGVKNGNETGIDCGGSCSPCATCDDGIKNGNETGVDCGGSCDPCTTCNDGVKNGNETGIDCGGSCEPCATCDDGIKNGNETEVDCGGDCSPCEDLPCTSTGSNTTYEYIQSVEFGSFINNTGNNQGYGDYSSMKIPGSFGKTLEFNLTPGYGGKSYKEGWSIWIDWNNNDDFKDDNGPHFKNEIVGGISGSINLPSSNDYSQVKIRIQMKWNSASNDPCSNLSYGEVEDYTLDLGEGNEPTCDDGVKNGNETGIDCGGECDPCNTCNDGIKNGNETGIDCGGECDPCNTCNDGIKNGNETGIDCGGDCDPCTTCDDGVKNGNETGVDCGGDCTPCPTCDDGIQNGNETGIDCGGECTPCEVSTDYCESKGGKTTYEHIKRVKIGDFENISGNNNGYGNYTQMTIQINTGQNYPIELEPFYAGNTYNEAWKIFIDLNQDGDFTDSGEQVFGTTAKGTVLSTIQIPENAHIGVTGLRIQMKWNSASAGPCSKYGWGEVEDYSISINSASIMSRNDIETDFEPTFYPNPVNNFITVDARQTSELQILIYDISGRLQFESHYSRPSKERINLSQLNPGFYEVVLISGEQRVVKKLIKN